MDTKKVLIKGLLGLLFAITIIVIIRILELDTIGVIYFLVFVSLIYYIYIGIKQKRKPTVKGLALHLIKSAVTITIIIYLFKWFGGFGFIGVFIGIVLLSLYKVWKRRKLFIESKHHLETAIFGKPLKKFKSGELKGHKIKVSFFGLNILSYRNRARLYSLGFLITLSLFVYNHYTFNAIACFIFLILSSKNRILGELEK